MHIYIYLLIYIYIYIHNIHRNNFGEVPGDLSKNLRRGPLQIAYPKLIEKYVGGELVVLGTDGFGAPRDSEISGRGNQRSQQ